MRLGAQIPRRLNLLLAVCVVSLHGQTTTSGAIAGVVNDSSGAVVPRATVVALDDAKANTQATTTNEEGLYTLSFLEPGSYTVTFAHSGFEDATRSVEVPLGSHATLNIVLKIALQRSTIQVTEQAPLIRAESGDVTATINRQEIDELPNPGNDRTYIVQTAPGMVMNTDYGVGNFSNLGMPGTSNLFTVNGMTFNDFGVNVNASGALGLTLGTNEVEEAAVVSNGYSGQFGGAAGANVTYITRSGGNQYHGNAKYYWNGRILNANDWFNNATGTPRQPDNVSEWAASLGGPIKKDKLFYFLSYDGLLSRQAYSLFGTVPTEPAKSGNLSEVATPVYDPATGTADGQGREVFAGNLIPASRFSSATQKILPLWPAANQPGLANNYFVGSSAPYNRHTVDAKVNYKNRGRP
jgi:hypothetical protein